MSAARRIVRCTSARNGIPPLCTQTEPQPRNLSSAAVPAAVVGASSPPHPYPKRHATANRLDLNPPPFSCAPGNRLAQHEFIMSSLKSREVRPRTCALLDVRIEILT